MLNGTITFSGKTQSDVEYAIEEALRVIKKTGCKFGMNSNNDGEYSFEITGDEEPDETES